MLLVVQIEVVRLTLVVSDELIIPLSPVLRIPLSIRDFVHIHDLDPLAGLELR